MLPDQGGYFALLEWLGTQHKDEKPIENESGSEDTDDDMPGLEGEGAQQQGAGKQNRQEKKSRKALQKLGTVS